MITERIYRPLDQVVVSALCEKGLKYLIAFTISETVGLTHCPV